MTKNPGYLPEPERFTRIQDFSKAVQGNLDHSRRGAYGSKIAAGGKRTIEQSTGQHLLLCESVLHRRDVGNASYIDYFGVRSDPLGIRGGKVCAEEEVKDGVGGTEQTECKRW